MSTGAQFFHALWLSLVVSGLAAFISALIGIPLGAVLSEFEFKGRRAVLTVVHAFMGLPPVTVGVFTFLLIMRRGPLGGTGIEYTAAAMVVVQVVLATPIIAGFTHASLQEVDHRLVLQAQSLGATRVQALVVELREARSGVVAAVIAGFGRVIAEVGAVTIVGGAINGKTDTLTTLSVKMTRLGNYGTAALIGVLLIVIAVIVNIFMTRLQADRGTREFEKRVTGYAD